MTGRSRRNWLMTASVAIGCGIWTMHFIAMMGFSVSGSPVRYDVFLTVLSLLVAIVVVGMGIFTVGYSQTSTRSLLLGGLGAGVGVAAMHYIGMAALHLHGRVGFNLELVALSVLIAVVAATAALWAALNVRSTGALWIAAPVMGLAVSSMHYTGMAAVRIQLVPSPSTLSGASAMEFIFPLAVGLGSLLFLTVAFVSLSPTVREWDVTPADSTS